MPHGFDTYRIFISTPGDLEQDRQACYEAIARTNEETAMPAKCLLVSVGLRDNNEIEANRSIVSDNVRWSTYFIQVFEDDWGPRDLFRKLFLLAAACREDASMPMREVVVFLKGSQIETNPEILTFRKELEEMQDVSLFRYRNIAELRTQLDEVCNGWARSVIDSAATTGG
jgi:hypothetical protein